jgi:hypothetical protein
MYNVNTAEHSNLRIWGLKMIVSSNSCVFARGSDILFIVQIRPDQRNTYGITTTLAKREEKRTKGCLIWRPIRIVNKGAETTGQIRNYRSDLRRPDD